MISRSPYLLLLCIALNVSESTGAVMYYTNRGAWQAELLNRSLSESFFETTSAQVALANEVGTAPVAEENLATTELTFLAGNLSDNVRTGDYRIAAVPEPRVWVSAMVLLMLAILRSMVRNREM